MPEPVSSITRVPARKPIHLGFTPVDATITLKNTLTPLSDFVTTKIAPTMFTPSTSPPTASFPGYEIVGELGRGGMGVVYKAKNGNGNQVAIKTVPNGAPRENVEYLLQEARTLFGLDHPGIPKYLGFGTDSSGKPFFAMELVPGETLSTHIAQGSLPVESKMNIIAKLAGTLAHLHKMGVVYCDLKPSNVMIRPDGVPIIIDHGLTVPFSRTEGSVRGSVPFAAPEQFRGLALKGSADMYAGGKVFYALLTGEPLTNVSHLPRAEAMEKILREETVSYIRERLNHPNIPPELKPVLADLLNPDPALRPSALELQQRLAALSPKLTSSPAASATAFVSDGPIINEPTAPLPETPTVTPEEVTLKLTLEPAKTPSPSRVAQLVVGAGGGFLAPFLSSMGAVAGLQALGVEDQGILFPAGIGAGHGAYVLWERAFTGKFPSLGTQFNMLGPGLTASHLTHDLYEKILNNQGVSKESWARSPVVTIPVSVGGGYLGIKAASMIDGAAKASGAAAGGAAGILTSHFTVVSYLLDLLDRGRIEELAFGSPPSS